MNDQHQGGDYYDGDDVLVFQDASISDSGNLSDFFNSNGSLGGFSYEQGEDFVTEPLTHNPGITFNQQAEMVHGDGTIKTIPLNTDGFYPSRQYESDLVDYEEDQDLSMSMNLDDADIAAVPSFAASLLPMAAEGVQALATMGADWWAARVFSTTENEEVLANENDNGHTVDAQKGKVEKEEERPNNDDDQLQQKQIVQERGAGDVGKVAADAVRAAR